jgi:hypothetical protein
MRLPGICLEDSENHDKAVGITVSGPKLGLVTSQVQVNLAVANFPIRKHEHSEDNSAYTAYEYIVIYRDHTTEY